MHLKRTGRVAVAVVLTCLAVLMLTAAPVPALDVDDVPDGDLPARVKVQENVSASSISCTAYASEVKWTPIRVWAEGSVSCTGTAARLTIEVELYRTTAWVTSKPAEVYNASYLGATVTYENCFPGIYQAKTKGSATALSGTPQYQYPKADGPLTIVTCT